MLSVRCDCCGGPSARRYADQEWGFCDDCKSAGCMSKRDGEGGMLRGKECPLRVAGPDVVMCLHCGKPNPGLGSCHARCVVAYHAARSAED